MGLLSFLKNLFSKIISKLNSIPSQQSQLEVPTSPNKLWGIDVSHHDGTIDFTKVKKAGASFVFIKATEGASFIDPKFKENITKAKEAGLLVGAYHFFRKSANPLIQAQHFYSVATSTGLNPIPVLDWESSDDASSEKDIAAARLFLETTFNLTGRMPVIYTGAAFGAELDLPLYFAHYPLWIAHYGVKSPKIPKPWAEYTFWQYTETGSVPGVPTKCDVNWFNGSIETLSTLMKS